MALEPNMPCGLSGIPEDRQIPTCASCEHVVELGYDTSLCTLDVEDMVSRLVGDVENVGVPNATKRFLFDIRDACFGSDECACERYVEF